MSRRHTHDFLESTVETGHSLADMVHQDFDELVAILHHALEHHDRKAEVDEARDRALPIIFRCVANMAVLNETLDLGRHDYAWEEEDRAH